MRRRRVVVVGSINRDFVIRAAVLPREGETVIGERFEVSGGGKGANQAVAAAVAGGGGVEVFMVGAVGAGPDGEAECAALVAAGVDVGWVARVEGLPTGTAFVTVDDRAANQIVVVPGANQHVDPGSVAAAVERIAPELVLVDLEVNLDAVAAALSAAEVVGAAVVLNPAPFRPLPPELYRLVDVAVPNLIEFGQLVGGDSSGDPDPAGFPGMLRQAGLGVSSVVVTLGAAGAALVTADAVEVVAAPRVRAVDTTGAGDAFCGGLGAALAAGLSLPEAVRFGVEVAAAAVQVEGARLVGAVGLPVLRSMG